MTERAALWWVLHCYELSLLDMICLAVVIYAAGVLTVIFPAGFWQLWRGWREMRDPAMVRHLREREENHGRHLN